MSLRRICFFLFFVMVAANISFAQGGGTGAILGTVTDSTGAVLPKAKVTITNKATSAAYVTSTSSAGDYSAPSLNPGDYSVEVEAAGFEKSRTTSFNLAVDQKIRMDVSMKPGAVSQVIEVSTQAVSLDTDSAALSQEISTRQANELPLNGRNFMQLLLVGAGAVTVGGEQGTMRQGQGNAISINGGRPESNNYTLDGLINTDTALVTPAVILSQDAIQEFKVQSGNYSAEYGFSANQVNIVSKSGTNSLHGTLFEFNRNDAYDARGPFQTTIPKLRQNQFGYVASGPVYIPKLYDGRNKTFWLANYEGWRINNGFVIRDSQPNPPTLTGDFSNEPLPVFNTAATSPCGKALAGGNDCLPIDPLTGLPFPGNVIPTARITNRFAQVAVANNYYDAPNLATNAVPGTINRQGNGGAPLTTNQQTFRIDQNLRRLGQIFGRGTYSNYKNAFLNGSNNLRIGFLDQFEEQRNWEVSHTISLGAASVNNFRFGYLHATAPQGGAGPSASVVSQLGVNGIFQKFGPLQLTWPHSSIGKFAGMGGAQNAYTGSEQPAWEYGDSFTTVHGRHTIGFGIDYRRWRLIRNLADDFLGDYSYSGPTVLTNQINCPTVTCGTGNATADFLLGYYNNGSVYQPGPLSPTDEAGNPQTHIFSYLAPYVEDDFKFTSRLTLNLGLRYDYRAAPYELHNHFFWRDVNNAAGGLCFADRTLLSNGVAPPGNGVYEYCGANVPKPGSKTPFAPRLGFAYRLPGDKTVIRGGYGVFWDSSEGREIDDSGDLYPYSIRTSLSPTGNPVAPKLQNDLFPSYGALGPIDPKSLTFLAVIESEDPLNPYVQQWSLSVQHQLGRSTSLEANYIGTKGTHLLDRRDIAQANGIPAADLPFCQADPKDAAHNCPTSTRKPYANFPGTYIDSDWHGYSNYNAMNLKMEHRNTQGAVTAIYTWARSLDDKSAAAGVGATGTGYQGFRDNHNPQADYGPSDFNVDQRFVASYIYDLPVGRGKKFLGNANTLENLVVGGWETTGITTFQKGFPYTIFASDSAGLLDTVAQRANITPGCKVNSGFTRTLHQWINTSCFTQPAIGVYGNTSRNFLRQPGINNWDIGVVKNFIFTENIRFAFRVESFNTFNHPQYNINVGGLAAAGSGGGSNPDSTLGDATFGQITQASPGRIIQLGGKLSF
jgi:hypothetical protein